MASDIRPVIVFFILVSSLQHIWYFTSKIDDAATRDDKPASLEDIGSMGDVLPAGYESKDDGRSADLSVIPAEERDNSSMSRRVTMAKAENRRVSPAGNVNSHPLGLRSLANTLLFGAPSPSAGHLAVPAPNTGIEGGIGPPSFDNWTLYLRDSTPLLLHQGLFDAPGCRRGGDPNGHGKRSAYLRYKVDSDGSLNPWDSATSEPESSEVNEREEKYVYPWDIIDKLPPRDTRYAFKTCALVSNSGSLLDAKFGREIDEHDAVFRMNNAPTEGFEKYVGSKTTFDLLNRPHAEDVSRMSSPEDQGNVSAVLFEADNWHLYRNILERQLKHMPYPSTLVLSPPFLSLINALWVRLAKRWPRYANSCDGIKKASMLGENSQRCQKMLRDCQNDVCKPSSGFFALLMASQMCNQIDMYGFESYRRPWSNKVARYHYFDEEEGTTAVHSFILIMKVFEFLSHRYPIVIKTPSYDPEKERMLEIKEREGKKQQKDKAASAEDSATTMLQQQLHLRQREKIRQQQILPYKQESLLKAYNLKHSGLLGKGAEGGFHVNSVLERVGAASVHAAQMSKARAVSKADIARYSS